MLMKRRNSSPQERKIRDYANQRTNAYGESKKNAYKAIRKRKRWVNRAYRKSVNNLLTQTQNETEEAEIGAIKRHQWRKCPDQLTMFHRENAWSGSGREQQIPNKGNLKASAIKRLRKSKRYDIQ